MKYLTLVFTLFLFAFSTVLLGQDIPEKKTISVGFEGGVQFTDVSDQWMISKGGTGINMGVFAEYPINDILRIRLGLNYDKRAFNLSNIWRLKDDTTGYFGDSYYAENIDYKANFATIPLSLLYMKGENRFKLYFQFTLYYSLLLDAPLDGNFEWYISAEDALHFTNPEWQSPTSETEHVSRDATPDFNTYDLGIHLYIGGMYELNDQWSITLSPGLTYGFANVWNNPERTSNWSKLFQINAGVLYQFK